MARLVRLFTPSVRFVEPSTNFQWTVAGLFAASTRDESEKLDYRLGVSQALTVPGQTCLVNRVDFPRSGV